MPLLLSETIKGCLFDMDGVLTNTAAVHADAWKQTFDEFLRRRSADGPRTGENLAPFDKVSDYDEYVDGRSRADGTRAFLQSRGIHLPEGDEDDPPDRPTIAALSNRKNELLLQMLDEKGVEVFQDTKKLLDAVKEAGLPAAVVSASANTAKVLEAAGLDHYFKARIDGVVASERHLPGKPHPDMYLAGAEALGVKPSEAAVFEDALAGVEAGRAGHFGLVVGVDRVGQADALRRHGADVVYSDLTELIGQPDKT